MSAEKPERDDIGIDNDDDDDGEEEDDEQFLEWADAQPKHRKFPTRKRKRAPREVAVTARANHALWSASVCALDAPASHPDAVTWSACGIIACFGGPRLVLCDTEAQGSQRSLDSQASIECFTSPFRPYLGTASTSYNSNELHLRHVVATSRAVQLGFRAVRFSPVPITDSGRFVVFFFPASSYIVKHCIFAASQVRSCHSEH